MRSFHKKMLFLELILFYVILIFVITENTNAVSPQEIRTDARIFGDHEKGEKIDPYTEQNRKVAITFDDGPDPVYTPELLDGLQEREVKATFFLLGKQVEKYPEIVERMQKEGHLIGTHSYKHVNLTQLCDSDAIEQVFKTNQLIFDITGEYPGYIRPPFGCWKCDLDDKTNMIEVLWDIDPLDWKTGNSDVIVKRVTDRIQENDIILMHDASESSVKAAFKIIDQLEEKGYEFVTVDEILLE